MGHSLVLMFEPSITGRIAHGGAMSERDIGAEIRLTDLARCGG